MLSGAMIHKAENAFFCKKIGKRLTDGLCLFEFDFDFSLQSEALLNLFELEDSSVSYPGAKPRKRKKHLLSQVLGGAWEKYVPTPGRLSEHA